MTVSMSDKRSSRPLGCRQILKTASWAGFISTKKTCYFYKDIDTNDRKLNYIYLNGRMHGIRIDICNLV